MNFSISSSSKSYVVFLPNIFPEQLSTTMKIMQDASDDESDLLTPVSDHGLDQDPNRDLDLDIDSDQEQDLDIDDILQNSSWSNKFDTTTDDLELIPATDVVEARTSTTVGPTRQLDELPKQFYNLERVPQTTNLACWGCGSCITRRPWQLAISVDRSDVEPGEQEQDFSTSKEIHLDLSDFRKQQQMEITKRARLVRTKKTHGIFCHVWCIGRYLKYPIDVGINRWQATELTKEMFKEREGKELLQIPVGESPYIMARYCGPSGISEDAYYMMNLNNLVSYIK